MNFYEFKRLHGPSVTYSPCYHSIRKTGKQARNPAENSLLCSSIHIAFRTGVDHADAHKAIRTCNNAGFTRKVSGSTHVGIGNPRVGNDPRQDELEVGRGRTSRCDWRVIHVETDICRKDWPSSTREESIGNLHSELCIDTSCPSAG